MDAKLAAGRQALAAAVAHVNVSVRDRIEADVVLSALKGGEVPHAFTHHVRAFLDETDVELLSDIARAGLADYATLARAARALLPAGHDTIAWLDERA